jgi:hypothetical protein
LEQKTKAMVIRRGDNREDILRRARRIYPKAGLGAGITLKTGTAYEALFEDAAFPGTDKPLALLRFSDSGEVLDCGVFTCPTEMFDELGVMWPAMPGWKKPRSQYWKIIRVGEAYPGEAYFLRSPGVALVCVDIPGAKSMDMMSREVGPNGSALKRIRSFRRGQKRVVWHMQYLQVGAEAVAIRNGYASVIETTDVVNDPKLQ